MRRKNVEILAPAGSYESMVAAVNAGAGAVYIGGSRFGARAYADNLDEGTMVRAIDFVHLHGCRIYMTVNTLVKERELSDLYDYLKPYYEAGLDAVLVQDLGVFTYIRENFPDLPIHISTQMTVTGKYSAASLKAMGAVRVVPARELSLKEIREIYESTGMEVETFVHGALCYCYSGQCLFSSLIGGRSGNRGRCAQTCRLPFEVEKDNNTISKRDEKYILSLKDLCTLDILPDILEAGVCSLKIEGRMKSPRYTAGVVSIYRKYVDLYLEKGRAGYFVEEEDRRTLLDLFDRGGQSNGYYEEHNGRDMVVLKEKPAFREANQGLFEYLDRTYVNTVKKEKIRGTAYFEAGRPARLTVSFALPDHMQDVKKKACAEQLIVWTDGDVVEEAKNAPMSEDRIRRQIMKTGDSPFEFESLDIVVKGNIFVPVQLLNQMRRDALSGLEKEITGRYHRNTEKVSEKSFKADADCGSHELNEKVEDLEFVVLVNKMEQFEAALFLMKKWKNDKGAQNRAFGIYLASEEFGAGEWKGLAEQCHKNGIFCYLMMPRIFRTEAEQYFLENLEILKNAGFDAIGVASMEEPGFLRQHMPEILLYFDHGMYVFNRLAGETMKNYGAGRITIPVELNHREIKEAGTHGELIVYGYLPMMVSAQCIQKTVRGCTKTPGLLYMKDRMGKKFPVANQCRFCYNTIYNESPLSLHGLSDQIRSLHPRALRLNFTVENRKTTEEILTAFYRSLVLGEKTEFPLKEFTRGHFKRGVE